MVEVLAIPDSNDAETGAPISGTRDITTDAFPVIGVVRTIITQDQYNQTPQPRFYSTVFTTLAVDNAISNASDGSSEADVLSGLDAAASLVSSVLGFGFDGKEDGNGESLSFDIFNTPPVIDEYTDNESKQAKAVYYRAASETFAALINNIIKEDSSVSVAEIFASIQDDIADANDDNINSNTGLAPVAPALTITDKIDDMVDGGSAALIGYFRDGVTSLDELVFGELDVAAPRALDSNDINPEPLSPDSDNDGVDNDTDTFPYDPSETIDTDGDGVGNNADNDDDDDGVNDASDAFPLDSTETLDTDGDGVGNNTDNDDDGDGVDDASDAFSLDSSESLIWLVMVLVIMPILMMMTMVWMMPPMRFRLDPSESPTLDGRLLVITPIPMMMAMVLRIPPMRFL